MNEIYLSRFLEARRQEGFGSHRMMKMQIKRLFSYLDEKGYGFTDVRLAEAQAYQGWLVELRRYEVGSLINFMKAAKAFYGWLKKSGIVYMNPFLEVRRIRMEKRLPRNILKANQMNRLLTALRDFGGIMEIRQKRRRYRVHVIAEFLYSTACRISEAASVKLADIDFSRGIVEITDAKSGYRRFVFLNDYAKTVLQLYVTRMRDRVLTHNQEKELLFGAGRDRLCVLMSRELSAVTQSEQLPPITAHGFRHAVGYHLLRAGCGIRQIQEILGHRAIKNTEVYTKVDKEDLKKVLDRFHPRAAVKRSPRETNKSNTARQ
jgi:site-specific recombinase XerD